MFVSVDFESYSELDIREVGLYNYAMHPSTELLVATFDAAHWLDSECVWRPGMPKPAKVLDHIAKGGDFSAFNAAFERIMWRELMVKRYGWPELPVDRWYCTAAQAAAMGLPKRLDHCGDFLGLKRKKDADGHKLMLKVSKPDKKGVRKAISPEDMQRLTHYNILDVRSETELNASLPQLSPEERKVWLLDQEINERGLHVDTDFAKAASDFWDVYLEALNEQVRHITGGISATQVGALTVWINQQGVTCVSLSKPYLQSLLEDVVLPDHVKRVIELRIEAGTTSVKKYAKFLVCTSADSRVRGTLKYHGASTGRWAGNLIQPQNFPRGILKAHEVPLAQKLVRAQAYRTIGTLWGSVGPVIGSLCRSVITAAPGKKLIAGDFEQVEARGIAWLAHESSMVRAFQNRQDVYRIMAGRIFGVQPAAATDHQRFLGKSAVLGCGYQMGPDRFKRQLKVQYNVDITLDLAKQCVYGYRNANPNIVQLWGVLEQHVTQAIQSTPTSFKRVGFERQGKWLFITLPSGRRLAYYDPAIHPVRGIEITAPSPTTGRAYRESLYGGKLAENIISGICRDLLVNAMWGLEAASYTVVGTVHDEIITETPDDPSFNTAGMTQIMEKLPAWAKGFPLAASGWEGRFYRK